MASLFQVSGVIQHQHRIGIAELIDHIAAHVVTHQVGVPHRLTQQPLHPMRRDVSGLLRQLPTRTRVHIRQQAKQKRPRPTTRLHPPEPASDTRKADLELLQPALNVYAVPSGRHKIFSCLTSH